MRVARSIAALGVAIACACAVATGVRAQPEPKPSYVWVEYEADGLPHVRTIADGGDCPALTAGGKSVQLEQRARVSPGFPDVVCDVALPANAAGARVAGTVLPAIPRAPHTIAVFADTGCRLKGDEVQACNDPKAWPFPTIARDIANAHPDLVIHVGDYYYLESPCPGTVDCTGSPHGDNESSWFADYFAPMVPVFAVAPVVNVRGNHEDCKRSPLGWARYLGAFAQAACVDHEPVYYLGFDDLLLGVVDDAQEQTEYLPDPPVFGPDEAAVEARAATTHRETWLLVHRPPVVADATHRGGSTNPHIAALLSGHIHTFGAYTLDGEPPQIINGMGGDNLATNAEITALGILGGVTDRRFGYSLFVRRGNGWDIVVHDSDTAVHRRCRLEARTIACGQALT
jgi:hypothetical protein